MSQTGQVEQVFVAKKVLVISVKCSPSDRTPSGQSDPVE